MKQALPAKISRPVLSGVVPRERLFERLDSGATKPLNWLCAPGGAGKSTLVASYLDARQLPCLWYYCDQGDADLATFFHYLGMAAKQHSPRSRKPLLHLTPEYLAGIATFTRRFFEKLYSLCPIIVLDNYESVQDDSGFNEMLATALDAAPRGVRVIVTSRGWPPPQLARLGGRDRVELLVENELRFSLAESAALVTGRMGPLDGQSLAALHERTQGWAAGMILMLEQPARLRSGANELPAGLSRDRIFDYFAGELFDKVAEPTRDFLVRSAFLPVLTPTLAERLTGHGSAGKILDGLNRNHYFTERLCGDETSYQYHPLFREFLLSRAGSILAADQIKNVRQRAGELLEQSGRHEMAAGLFAEAADHEALGRMVAGHGRTLLLQGRNRILQEWLSNIPEEVVGRDPWLLYWSGLSSFPMDLPRSCGCLCEAFALFRAKADSAGSYLSWAGVVDTYTFGDDWKDLDGWIDLFDQLTKESPAIPSQEIDLIVSSRMLMALTLRRTEQPARIDAWLKRVTALLQESPSPDIQIDTIFCMSVYYLWTGEYRKNALLLERAEAEIHHRRPSPFAAIRIKLMKGIHLWLSAEYALALKALAEGLEISAESGVRLYDSLLWSFRTTAELASGNHGAAKLSLQNQLSSLLGMETGLNLFFYHLNSAWLEMLEGDAHQAAEHLDTIFARTEKMGNPYYLALWHICMAQAAFQLGQAARATDCLQTALRISRDMKSKVLEWYGLLIDAWLQLQQGNQSEGVESLRRGLALGREHGYVHLECHQPAITAALYAKALVEGIEPEYVRSLIGKLGLALPEDAPPVAAERWPCPVKIRTLGRFEILRDDQLLQCSGKEQKKPLELLKLLIAHGGSDVAAERIIDTLWLDSDGDQGQKSLEITLSRLRKLLGSDNAILHRSRKLTINRRHCCVDSLILAGLLDRIPALPGERVLDAAVGAVAFYRGEFLPGDREVPWSAPMRETVRNRILLLIGRIGSHHQSCGDLDLAADYYRIGIETDDLAEPLYRGLMLCLQQLGNHADVARTYHLCRTRLKAGLGVAPSPETTAIYQSIQLD